MQHIAFEFRPLALRDPFVLLEMREGAQHPTQRIAQFAIIVGDALQNFRADALIIGIVNARDPQPQNVGSGLADHLLRHGDIAERF